jgi:hypothetical protein
MTFVTVEGYENVGDNRDIIREREKVSQWSWGESIGFG